MPTLDDLRVTIDQRYEQIHLLLNLTAEQETAIENGHMNELMRILGEKQRLIEHFVASSKKLQTDRESFTGELDLPESYRVKHEQTAVSHAELLRREAACQASLESSREKIAEELGRGESARRAAAGYRQPDRQNPSRGGGLDLSNDA